MLITMANIKLEITDNIEKMTELGKLFVSEHPDIYSEEFIQTMWLKAGGLFENYSEFLENFYGAAYCQQIYGTSFIEYATFHFANKSHEEKTHYVTWDSRFLYMAFLNNESYNHILDNKFEAYQMFKPFYKREAILISDENDYKQFCEFTEKHPNVFVKPNNLELAEGVHRLKYKGSLRETFDALLKEAKHISSDDIKREIDHRLILEEIIVPSEFIKHLNPHDMSLFRVTTILLKDEIHYFYPCLRLLVGDGKETVGENYSYVALIDSESGTVISNGKSGFGDVDNNPITGEKIKGMQIPEWEELKSMLCEAARMIPEIRYIGWDVTHTDNGWCIIEGNPSGEFFYQMGVGHGVKDEFEDLIGFKVPYDFWKNHIFHNREKHSNKAHVKIKLS